MKLIKDSPELNFVSQKICPIFQKFREFYNPDVKVKVDDVVIDAHKVVLERASPVLETMLSVRYWKYGDIVELKEFVDSEILEDLINYFYTAEISFTLKNVSSICIASHFLQISELLSVSEKFLIENLFPSNVEDFLTLSNIYDLKNLQEHCKEYIFSIKYCFRNDERLLKMNFEEYKKKIKTMFDGNEDSRLYEEIFYLVMNWVTYDKTNRERCINWILYDIKLEKTSLKFINEVVRFHPLLRYSNVYFGIIEDHHEKILKNNPSASFDSSYLYCLGGESSEESFRRHSSKSASSLVSRYDPETKKWIDLYEMLVGRRYFSAIAFETKIYVFGGDTRSGITNLCEVYDCKLNWWFPIMSMHVKRINCGVAEYRGDLYVFYGKDSFGRFINSVERYSIRENKWKLFQFDSKLKIQPEVQSENRFLGIHNNVFYCLSAETNENSGMNYYIKASIKGFDMNSLREKPSRDVSNLLKIRSIHQIHQISTTMHNGKIFFQNFEGLSYLDIDSNIPNHISTSNYSPGQCLIFLNNKLLRIGGYNKNTCDFEMNIGEFDAKNKYWNDYIRKMDVPRANHCSVVANHPVFPRYNETILGRNYFLTAKEIEEKTQSFYERGIFKNIKKLKI